MTGDKIKKVPYDGSLPDCYVFDIDGTLAHMNDRTPFEWDKVGDDSVDEHVALVLDELVKEYKIIIVTGREDVCKEATEQWLLENDIVYGDLYMRPKDDRRTDVEVKKEIYDSHLKDKYNVLGVFEDRDQVVELWRSLGLTCFQVAYGNF